MVPGRNSERGNLPKRVHRLRGESLPGYHVERKSALQHFLAAVLALVLIPSLVSAGGWTGGLTVTTVQSGTVTGDLWIDALPAPDWGSKNVVKVFTLPPSAVAEPGRITWARLYVSAYVGHMQNDYAFMITNRWDSDGTGGYEQVWPETGHAPFQYMDNGYGGLLGNDNSAFTGHGTNESYKMINDHENRVTSDYFMWYNVTDLITNQTVFVNTETTGSYDGRIKLMTLVVAYDDPASTTQTKYWINQGHDSLAYYTEDNLGYIDTGNTTFGTRGTGPFTSAILTINHLASNPGVFGFPSAANDQCYNDAVRCPGSKFITFAEALPDTDRLQAVQGPYAGVIAWNVTSRISVITDGSSVRRDVTLGYARDLTATGLSAFFKIPLAFLVLKSPMAAAAPVADFTANQSSGIVPLAVQFNDTSTGSPTAWSWDFNGDGISDSTDQNASYVYTAVGTYNVSLNVTSLSGSNMTVKSGFIEADAPPIPVAAFINTTPRSGTAPLTVQFNDTSTGSPSAWNWTFGDTGAGNTSTLRNASHTYTSPGAYSVNLSVISPGGTNFTVKQNYVMVSSSSGIPVATFSASPLSGTVPLTVSFTDQSVGSPTSWSWDFNNDGIVDNTTPDPVYTYANPGSYTVKLNATNAYGSDDEVRTGYIAVFSGTVALAVDPPVQPLNTSETQDIRIVLDNVPTGLAGYDLTLALANPGIAEITGVTYPSWAQLTKTPLLPNQSVLIGGTDTNHLVEPGATAVTLATIRIRGNLTGMTPVVISTIHPDDDNGDIITPSVNGGTVVVGTYDGPVAAFAANQTSGMANLTVQFTDLSSGSPTSWMWDFDNNGIIDSNHQNPSCTYTGPGSYTVNLTVANTKGSHTLVRPGYITVSSGTTPPIATFSGTPRSGSAPMTVQFSDLSTGSPTSWAWDFNNDGIVDSTARNPGYTYSSAGTYSVRLTASNAAGPDTSTQSNYITVTAGSPNAPVASFTANPTSGTPPLAVTFTDTSTGSPESWYWNFGNGQTSVLRTTTVTYSNAGVYPVTLNVSNEDGYSTASRSITVNTATGLPGVAFSASPTTGAVPLSVSFTDQSSGSPTSWKWDFDNDGSVDSTIQNPSHTYSAAGTYSVTLTATNNVGSDSLTRSSLITATSSSTTADLTIKTIVPNIGSVSGGSLFALVQNPVTVNIEHSGTESSPASSVKLHSNDGFSGTATVPAIAAGSSATVKITDSTVRQTAGSSITYTATVDPDSQIAEANENNNVKSGTFTVKYNGYMGKRYWSGGNDIITRQTFDLNGSLAYSRGDSVYRSGSFGNGGWLSYTVNWKGTEPTIPSGSTVRAAYLYVPYTWDNEHIAPDHTFVDFNGQRVSRSSWNYDKSNFGVYADYEWGLLKYDVTSLYKKNEANGAVFTRENPKYSDPAQAAVYTKISMYEFFLVVVYEDPDSTRKQIFINDNFDLLGASSEYGTTSAQATAYVPFTGMTIDKDAMTSATLITFVPSGDSHEGNLLYNGNVLASNVWDYGSSGTGVDGIPQVAVDRRDVTSSIQATGNTFAIQSTDKGGTPSMAAIQQFLIVDLGDSATTTAITTTTTTTTATTTTTVTPTTTWNTVSLASGSTGSGATGGSGSNGGGQGLSDTRSSGQQGGRYQAGPVEKSDILAGETTADASGVIPEGLPPNLILGCLCLVGATSVIAYRQGWIVNGQPGMRVYWEGPGRSTPSQILDLGSGTIQYRHPVFAGCSRTHLILLGVVIAGAVVAGAAWSFGLLPYLSSGSPGLLSSDSGQGGNFDLIPTIENIQDLDMTNHVPDYPPGFSARNGILFVYHGTEKYKVSDLELKLTKGTSAVTLTPSTVPPPVNAVNGRLSTYFEEMGNGDGILDPDEWLMIYADNCYDSSRADGEPKGKVLVWQPQDAGSVIEVPLKDTIGYSLKETADGTILQQGTVMLVPTTP